MNLEVHSLVRTWRIYIRIASLDHSDGVTDCPAVVLQLMADAAAAPDAAPKKKGAKAAKAAKAVAAVAGGGGKKGGGAKKKAK